MTTKHEEDFVKQPLQKDQRLRFTEFWASLNRKEQAEGAQPYLTAPPASIATIQADINSANTRFLEYCDLDSTFNLCWQNQQIQGPTPPNVVATQNAMAALQILGFNKLAQEHLREQLRGKLKSAKETQEKVSKIFAKLFDFAVLSLRDDLKDLARDFYARPGHSLNDNWTAFRLELSIVMSVHASEDREAVLKLHDNLQSISTVSGVQALLAATKQAHRSIQDSVSTFGPAGGGTLDDLGWIKRFVKKISNQSVPLVSLRLELDQLAARAAPAPLLSDAVSIAERHIRSSSNALDSINPSCSLSSSIPPHHSGVALLGAHHANLSFNQETNQYQQGLRAPQLNQARLALAQDNGHSVYGVHPLTYDAAMYGGQSEASTTAFYAEATNNQRPQQQGVCYAFARHGSCINGNACQFSHAIPNGFIPPPLSNYRSMERMQSQLHHLQNNGRGGGGYGGRGGVHGRGNGGRGDGGRGDGHRGGGAGRANGSTKRLSQDQGYGQQAKRGRGGNSGHRAYLAAEEEGTEYLEEEEEEGRD